MLPLILRLAIPLVRERIVKSSVKSAESYRSCSNAIESYPEVDNVAYRSGVHKLLMVRMYICTDELANVRIYRIGVQKCILPAQVYCDKGCGLWFSKNRRYEKPRNVTGIGKSQVQSEHLKVNVRIKSLER